MEKPIYTFAKWSVQDGHLSTVLGLLSELSDKSAAEAGNLAYLIHQAESDPNTLILFEGYTDESALAAHRESEHFQRLVIGEIAPLLEHREIIKTIQISPA